MDPGYWRKKFLYPFALDPAPLRLKDNQKPEDVVAEKKRQKLLAEESLMQTTKFQFPISHMKKPEEFLSEVQRPITMTVEDIKQDLNVYVKKFPKEVIPHITETNEVCDNIHNYKNKPRAQVQKDTASSGGRFTEFSNRKLNTALTQGMPTLREHNIVEALREI